MTSHDEKILQLLDRIHTTAQGRREKAVDGAVQTMERVNRTSYGALRDLTENGHKKAGKNPVRGWPSQELLVDDDHVAHAEAPRSAAPVPPTTEHPAAAEDAAGAEITQVMGALRDHAGQEATAVTYVPEPPTAITVAPVREQAPTREQTPGTREYAARHHHSPEEREHIPGEVVSGDGATYGGGGSASQQTQVIWFRRLFRRR